MASATFGFFPNSQGPPWASRHSAQIVSTRSISGFAPDALNGAIMDSPLRHLQDVPVLHWHSDTFELPRGVDLLASTDAYAHQAFRRGRNLLALQFHAEMGEDPRFEDWLTHFWADLDIAQQCGVALRRDHETHGPGAVAAGRAMIADWLAQLRT